jgi:N6-adenosine-specific RNA methylase IME4
MIPHALEVMAAWGFTYKTIGFVWAKTTSRTDMSWAPKYHMGLGYWTRANVEIVLLGVRGKPKRTGKGVRQLIVAPKREHSRKPDEFYERAERLCDGPYLELFSRQSRPGWSAFGNEVGKFDEVAA